MRSIIVDAGPLIALFLKRDTHHRQAVEWAKRTSARLITTWPVVCEACFFFGPSGKHALFTFIQRGAVEVSGVEVADLLRLGELLAKYPDMDFADGTSIMLAEKTGTTDIATIDNRDSSAYRTRDGRAFRNVFC